MIKEVLMTEDTAFIGGNLSLKLKQKAYEITALDNLYCQSCFNNFNKNE